MASAPPVDPNEQAEQRFALTKAWFEHLGIPLPEAKDMDELVGCLEEASKADAPLDSLSKRSK